jgi:hypothetical protein
VRGRRHLGVIVFGGLLSWWVASPGVAHIGNRIVGDNGDAMWQLSVLRWTVDAIEALRLPWTPPMFFPTTGTYAYSDPMLTQALLLAPFRAAGASPALGSNIVLLLTWTASVYCAWRLLRRVSGSDAVALAGATAWAFSELRLGTIVLFQLVTAAMFLPLVLELLLVTLERPTLRRGGLLGAAAAAAVLAALYYGPLLALCVPTAAAVWFVVARQRPTRAHVAALVLAGVVAAAPVLPIALRYRDIHDRDHLHRAPEATFSATASDLTGVTGGHELLAAAPVLERAANGERALFPGLFVVAAVPAAAFALLKRRRRSPERDRRPDLCAVAAAGVVAYLLAAGTDISVFGRSIPGLLGVLDGIPGFDGIRAPVRFAVLGHLGLVAVACCALTVVVRHVSGRAAVAVVVALVSLSLVDLRSGRPTAPVPDAARWSAVDAHLAELPRGPVVELPILQGPDGAAHPRVEAPRLYLAGIDGNRRVNGYSGFQPPGFDALTTTLNTFPAPAAVEVLERTGVRYVVLRTDVVGWRTTSGLEYRRTYGEIPVSRIMITPGRLAAIRAGLPPTVREVGTFGHAVLLELIRR